MPLLSSTDLSRGDVDVFQKIERGTAISLADLCAFSDQIDQIVFQCAELRQALPNVG